MRRATDWLLLAVCACGDNVPCESGRAVALGTGDGVFEPMPLVLDISDNGQAGIPYLPLRTRIWGIPPGDPTNELSPGNPTTVIHAAVDPIGWRFDGTAMLGYGPVTDAGGCEGDDVGRLLRLTLTVEEGRAMVGLPVEFLVMVIGNNGATASADMTVTVGSYPVHDAGAVD